MHRANLSVAKARLSELVDKAEREGRETLILRHGKPVAVLGPARPSVRGRRPWTAAQIRKLFGALEDGGTGAVDDLLRGRR